MLIRFIVGNLYSFAEKTEFNMLTGDVRRHPHHVHKLGKVEVLRAAAVYGANGAGKSNLVKALDLLRDAATSDARSLCVALTMRTLTGVSATPRYLPCDLAPLPAMVPAI